MDSLGMEMKFMQWLLLMGYPPEHMLSQDNFKEYYTRISRGHQYGKVWKNLIQNVKPESVVKHQRYAIFLDDVKKCENAEKKLDKCINPPYKPKELSIWNETKELRKQVDNLEKSICSKKKTLNAVMQSIDLNEKELKKKNIEDSVRKQDLILMKTSEMEILSEQLDGTTKILEDYEDKSGDSQVILNKCIAKISELLSKYQHVEKSQNTARNEGIFNSTAMSCKDMSAISDFGAEKDLSEYKKQLHTVQNQLSSLLSNVTSSQILTEVNERQRELIKQMSELAAKATHYQNHKEESEPATSHLSAASTLHCSLVLKTINNQLQTSNLTKEFAQLIKHYINTIKLEFDNDENLRLELFVLSCEKAELLLKQQLDTRAVLDKEVMEYCGVLADAESADLSSYVKQIERVDQTILTKKHEIETFLTRLDTNSSKMLSVCGQTINFIESVLSKNKNETSNNDTTCFMQNYDDFKHYISGKQYNTIDPYSRQKVYEFYENILNREKSIELSFTLDANNSEENTLEKDNMLAPKIANELKYFFNKFSFELNRKIVLDSGESLWLNETLRHLGFNCQTISGLSSLDCLTVVRQIVDKIRHVKAYEKWAERLLSLNLERFPDVDISKEIASITQQVDKIKKKNPAILQEHEKSANILQSAFDNLEFWSGCHVKKYLSDNRTVRGESYADFDKRLNIICGRKVKRERSFLFNI